MEKDLLFFKDFLAHKGDKIDLSQFEIPPTLSKVKNLENMDEKITSFILDGDFKTWKKLSILKKEPLNFSEENVLHFKNSSKNFISSEDNNFIHQDYIKISLTEEIEIENILLKFETSSNFNLELFFERIKKEFPIFLKKNRLQKYQNFVSVINWLYNRKFIPPLIETANPLTEIEIENYILSIFEKEGGMIAVEELEDILKKEKKKSPRVTNVLEGMVKNSILTLSGSLYEVNKKVDKIIEENIVEKIEETIVEKEEEFLGDAWVLIPDFGELFSLNEFLENNFIGINLYGFKNHLNSYTINGLSFSHELRKKYPLENSSQLNDRLEQLKDFFSNVKKGDYVLLPNQREVYIGKIGSERCEYFQEFDNVFHEFPYQWEVQWLFEKESTDRYSFPEDIQKSLRARNTKEIISINSKSLHNFLNDLDIFSK